MRRMTLTAMALCATGAMTLAAQQPGARRPARGSAPRRAPAALPMPGGMAERGMIGGALAGPAASPAEFLLAHTGELELTDAQVTRLAAIARRAAARRQAMRSTLDSLRPGRARGMMRDSTSREQFRQRMEQMRPAMERLREQAHTDRRDAITVLTPDQQARAWERMAAGARGGRGAGFRAGQMRGPGMRGAPMGGARMGERRMRMRMRAPEEAQGPRRP